MAADTIGAGGDALMPRDETDVVAAALAALANATPLEVTGTATKRALGRPVEPSRRLTTAALTGVTLYEPAELVMTARAGTPIRDIIGLLDQQGQELAFEPVDLVALYGGQAGAGTIGGLIATNGSGPRRIKAGAARDHLLGFRAVSGRGEVFKSGGRVMKNVTGYDLSKLVTGSYGTLAVLTEVTFKVLPKAETEATVIISGLDTERALAVLRVASGLPYDVSGLAAAPDLERPGCAAAALRLEGPEISVRSRRDSLIAHFKSTGAAFDTLDAGRSRAHWAGVRDARAVAGGGGAVWRISVAPTLGGNLVDAIRRGGVQVMAHAWDWAGGLVWLAVAEGEDAAAGAVRGAVDAVGGHATLVRASAAVRSRVPVFHPQPPALAALTARVKLAFDPERILNRGRVREGL